MSSRRVFHESFDSTRATAEAAEDDPNLVQGQIEAIISLLLGRSLAINNAYGLDSRTLLELADATLSARDRVFGTHPNGGSREQLRTSMPFMLFRWRQPTYFAACADQFRRHDRGARDYFRLSAWGPMNDDAAARELLASAFDRMDRDRTIEPFPAELARTYPELARHYDTVLRLNDYFHLASSNEDARLPRIQLGAYVRQLIARDPAALSATAEDEGWSPDLTVAVRRVLAHRLEAVEDPNFLRGWAHDTVNELDPDDDRLFLMELVREFIDTVYNAVLADSARAHFEYMSSVPRADGRDELKHMNALALRIIRDTRKATAPELDTHGAERLAARMGGLYSAAAVLPSIPAQPLEQILIAYWEILADPDAARSWAQSVDRLHEELRGRHLDPFRFQDAWSAHLGQLEQMLPHIVQVDGVEMAVSVRHGERHFSQTQQLGDIDRDALDAALAAGEHLDDLGHAASGVDRD